MGDKEGKFVEAGSWRRWRKYFLIVGGIAGTAVIIGSFNFPAEKTIKAGEIEIENPTATSFAVKGSFTVSTPILRFRTVPSQGTGGACLVADMNQLPSTATGKCLNNSECYQSLPDDWAGYCEKETGKCWVRPGSQGLFCNVSGMYPPVPPGKKWTDETKNPVPISSPYSYQYSLSTTDWRVMACLNKKNAAGVDEPLKGCADPTYDGALKMQVFGATKPVNVRPVRPNQ